MSSAPVIILVRPQLGENIGKAARAMLTRHGIPVVSESLFGVGHRQIIFDVSKGDVWAHQVRPTRSTIDTQP